MEGGREGERKERRWERRRKGGGSRSGAGVSHFDKGGWRKRGREE